MVICLEQGANLHIAQLMPLPLTVSCFSKIQIGFTFLVPAHPSSPGKRAVKRVCVCVPAHLGSPAKGPLNGCVCVCVQRSYNVGEVSSCNESSNKTTQYTRTPVYGFY